MTKERRSLVRHILGFALAPGIGSLVVLALTVAGMRLTREDGFVEAYLVAFYAVVPAYVIFLGIALPLHIRYLRRRRYGFARYLGIGALAGLAAAALAVPLARIVPSDEPHDFEVVATCVLLGVVITAIFWAIAMWRNAVYPPFDTAADVSGR